MKTAESIVDVRRAGPEDAQTVLTMVREIAALEGDASDVVSDPEPGRRCWPGPTWSCWSPARRPPAGYVSAVRRLHLWLGTDILALDDLYVREGFRDAGVGRLLMRDWPPSRTGLLIRWEMREDNLAAQRFYRRLGASLRTKVIACGAPDLNPARANGHRTYGRSDHVDSPSVWQRGPACDDTGAVNDQPGSCGWVWPRSTPASVTSPATPSWSPGGRRRRPRPAPTSSSSPR